MAKYIYPAIFTPEEGGSYSIRFPDFESCYTSAESLEGGMEMANDVLCLTLYGLEEEDGVIPTPSSIQSIATTGDEFTTLISCDTMEYRKFFDNKAVKKNLTIPSWLNTMAERQGINFSFVLQTALKEQLHVQ
jgi:predicted RNase H-like HicB family nuclease